MLLISNVQQSESTLYVNPCDIHSLPWEPPSGLPIPSLSRRHHRAPRRVSCAIQQVPTSQLFYTCSCIYVTLLSKFVSSSSILSQGPSQNSPLTLKMSSQTLAQVMPPQTL